MKAWKEKLSWMPDTKVLIMYNNKTGAKNYIKKETIEAYAQ